MSLGYSGARVYILGHSESLKCCFLFFSVKNMVAVLYVKSEIIEM